MHADVIYGWSLIPLFPLNQAIDKWGYPTCFSLAGNLMFLITFTFVGPVSFVPIAPAEHLIQVMPMPLMDNPDRQTFGLNSNFDF